MPAIVEYPEIVNKAMKDYGEIFKNEPEREHFGEYVTGLMIAERKTVSGINREFAVRTDQSCLNRWATEVEWDVGKLNERRLGLLQEEPSTRYSAQGVIAIDNVLVDHDGKLIEDVGWFWDHAEKRHVIAHDYLIANYVCTSGKHYPLEFRRFRKREQCEKDSSEFKNHTILFQELAEWVIEKGIPGDFAFDCWFTHAGNLNYIHSKNRGYAGDLKFNRKIRFKGREMKASEAAGLIPPEDRKMIGIGDERQWYFTKTVRIDGIDHPVRLVILWKHKGDAEAAKMLVTNRVWWDVTRIVRVYRRRWTGTELFHRDGKQHLGMGDCQMRSGRGQTVHMYMVFVAYSLLMSQLKQGRVREWAMTRLTTIGQACRAVLCETLTHTIDWVLQQASSGWSHEQIKSHLALAPA
jgi:hypothetical protein